MSRNYKFYSPKGTYFISFAVVGWIDVLTRNEYKNILPDCLRYCQKEKGMEIFAYNHTIQSCGSGMKNEE